MPRVYKRRINWEDPVARRAYNAALQRRRRAAGLVPSKSLVRKIPCHGLVSGYPKLLWPEPVKQKRDIFEVAARLYAELKTARFNLSQLVIGQGIFATLDAALADYRQFWEED